MDSRRKVGDFLQLIDAFQGLIDSLAASTGLSAVIFELIFVLIVFVFIVGIGYLVGKSVRGARKTSETSKLSIPSEEYSIEETVLKDVVEEVPEKKLEMKIPQSSEIISIKRGYETAGQYLKVGIKVENSSESTITDVNVKLDVPSALERVNPKIGIVELGVIKPSSFQSANFQLTPIRCVNDFINAAITFHDASGEMKMQKMKPLEIRSVCPMLTGDDVDKEKILMKLRDGKLKKNKASFKFKGDPRTAFIMSEARIRGLIPLDKDEKYIEDTYVASGCYIGRTKYGEFDFATEIIVSGKQREGLLTITVYSNEEAILSGFFYEVLQDVKKHIEITQEKIDVVERACPECGGQLDLSKANEERYLKCDLCETLCRLPPWEK